MNANPDDIDAFIAAKFPDDITVKECRTINGYGIARSYFHERRGELARRCRDAADAGCNVFLGEHERIERGSGKASNVLHARTLVADFDAEHLTATEPAAMVEEARARVDRAMLPPWSMLGWSGRGLHVRWILAYAMLDLDLIETTQDAIATTLGSDPAVCDRARIMRCLGTMNRKPGGSMARIVEFTGDRYAVDDIASAVWHGNTPDVREPDPVALDAAIGSKAERSGIGPGGQVIDAFNAATPLRDLLTSYGYDVVGHRFRRPGKDGRDWSGIIRDDKHGRRVSCHWSTNDKLNGRAFGKGRTMDIHDSFDVFRLLTHHGDTTAAVTDAARRLGIPLPRQRRDGDVLKAIDASADGTAFDALYFGDDDAPDRERRMIAILARHTTNPKQVGRLLAAARQRTGAACPA